MKRVLLALVILVSACGGDKPSTQGQPPEVTSLKDAAPNLVSNVPVSQEAALPSHAKHVGVPRPFKAVHHSPGKLTASIGTVGGAVNSYYDISKVCTNGSNLSSGNPCRGWAAKFNSWTPPFEAYFPPGYYEQDRTLNVTTGDYVHGAGMSATVIENTSGFVGNGINDAYSINGSHNSSVRLSGFTLLNNNAATNTFGIGIYELDGSYFYVDHVRFSNWFAGVALDQTEIAYVDHCDFEMSSYAQNYQPNVSGLAVTQVGTPGSTTVAYEVMNVHSSLNSIGAPITTSTSNATLTTGNYNHVAWTDLGAGYTYRVYRAAGGGFPRGLVCSVSTPTHACDDKGTLVNSTTALLPPRGVWLVDGINVTEGVTPGFTNAIWIDANNYNMGPGAVGVVDDGGDMHTITSSQFNGGAVGAFVAGTQSVAFTNNYMEAQTQTETIFDYQSFDFISGVGGCSGINFTGNFISCSGIASITNRASEGPWVITGNDFDCSTWPFAGAGTFGQSTVSSNYSTSTTPVSGYVGNQQLVVLAASGHVFTPNASIGIGSKNSVWTIQLENGQADSVAASAGGQEAGLTYTFVITQSASSASTLAWDSSWHWTRGVAPSVDPALNSVTTVTCVYTNTFWCSAGSASIPTSDVAALATGGIGTSGSPWTGWETAINSAAGYYHFSPGYYRLTTLLSPHVNTTLRGDGQGLSIITTGPSYVGGAIRIIGTINSSTIGNVLVDGLTVSNGNASTNTHSVGIEITAISFVTISNVEIDGFWTNGADDQGEVTQWEHDQFMLSNQFTASVAKPVVSPSITPLGTPGTHSYALEVVANYAGGNSISIGAATGTGATTVNGTDSLQINWSAPVSGSPTGYDVYLKYTSAAQTLGKVGHVSSGATHTYTWTGGNGDATKATEIQRNLWFVNGPELNPTSHAGFTNANDVKSCNFNSSLSADAAAIHLVYDGGSSLNITGASNFNGGDKSIVAAGALGGLTIAGSYAEGFATRWLEVNDCPLDDGCVVNAGGGVTYGATLQGNTVSNGSQAAVRFTVGWTMVSVGNSYLGSGSSDGNVEILGGVYLIPSGFTSYGDYYPTTTTSLIDSYSDAASLTASSHAFATNARYCKPGTCIFYALLENGQADTLSNPVGLIGGWTYVWDIQQSASSASTLTYDTLFDWPGSAAPPVTTTLNGFNFIHCIYDNIKLRCRMLGNPAILHRDIYSSAGTTTWTAPAGVTKVTIYGRPGAGSGAGGCAGGNGFAPVTGGGGGGGGAGTGGGGASTQRIQLTVVPTSAYTVITGAGGASVAACTTGNSGAYSEFSLSGTILARFGQANSYNNGSATLVGAWGGGKGTIGGNGGVTTFGSAGSGASPGLVYGYPSAYSDLLQQDIFGPTAGGAGGAGGPETTGDFGVAGLAGVPLPVLVFTTGSSGVATAAASFGTAGSGNGVHLGGGGGGGAGGNGGLGDEYLLFGLSAASGGAGGNGGNGSNQGASTSSNGTGGSNGTAGTGGRGGGGGGGGGGSGAAGTTAGTGGGGGTGGAGSDGLMVIEYMGY